jgi:hypothetical protein
MEPNRGDDFLSPLVRPNELDVVPILANKLDEGVWPSSLVEFEKRELVLLIVADWGAPNSPPVGAENRLTWLLFGLLNKLSTFLKLAKILSGLFPDEEIGFYLLSDFSSLSFSPVVLMMLNVTLELSVESLSEVSFLTLTILRAAISSYVQSIYTRVDILRSDWSLYLSSDWI